MGGRAGSRPTASAAGGRPQSRTARAWSRVTRPFRPGGQLGGRSRGGPGSKPSSAGGARPGGPTSGTRPHTGTGRLAAIRSGAGQAGRAIGRGLSALYGQFRKRGPADGDDDFDLDGTYEVGVDGTKINGKLQDEDVTEARARANAREKAAKKAAKTAPVWPNVDVDELPAPPPPPPPPANPDAWPDYDVDDYAPKSERRPPKQSLPAEQDHAPPPPPTRQNYDPAPPRPVSPPSHREKSRKTPRITSTNTGGKAMSVSPNKYNDLVTNATSRQQGWQAAADAFRRDSADLDAKAKEHDEAARIFKATGNHAAAEDREDEARKLRDDGRTCMTYAAKMQEKANEETAAA